MFFFSLGIFLTVLWLLPWWCLAIASFALAGVKSAHGKFWHVAAAGGVAWFALSFIQDGRSHGLISQKISQLLGLPHPYLLFVLMGMIGALTALFCVRAGMVISQWISIKLIDK